MDLSRKGPSEDASGANLLARAGLTGRRVVKVRAVREYRLPFTDVRVCDRLGGFLCYRADSEKGLAVWYEEGRRLFIGLHF